MTAAERRVLLGALGFLSFATVYAGVVMSPVLTQIAGEFGTSTGTAGLAVAVYALPGIVIALLAGPYSDRYGRKPFLLGGSLLMGVFTIVAAVAPSFELLIASRAVAGIGASVIYPNINASVGDSFAYGERGRAISTVIGMNTFASIAGVPLAGIVAEATTWRISLVIVGVLALTAATTLFVFLPHRSPGGDIRRARELYLTIVRRGSAVAAIVSSLMGALYWFTWITYLVVFFQQVYALSQGAASTVALTTGLGVLLGSQIGGRLGDRIGHRRIVAGTITLSAAFLLLLTNVAVPLPVATALNLVLSTIIGARFTTNTAMLTEQVPEARGTMLATSSSVVNLGIVVGATAGGIVIDRYGFGVLGLLCAIVAITSASIVTLFVTEEPLDLETQTA